MPDTAHPNAMPPNDWNTAFAALPLEAPPSDGWSRLYGALDARAAIVVPQRRNRWLALAAVLATAALVPLLLMRERASLTPPNDAPAPATATVSPSTPPAAASRISADTIASALPSSATAATGRAARSTGSPSATAEVAEPARMASRQSTTKRSPTPTRRAASTAVRDTAARPGQAADAIASGATADTNKTVVDAGSDRDDTLMQLQAESARLEALVAMTRDDRVGSAAATVMSAELGQRIGLIDAGLTQNTLPLDQREALWRERVRTLRDLAGVETTQLWLAAQGERYDGALVSVD